MRYLAHLLEVVFVLLAISWCAGPAFAAALLMSGLATIHVWGVALATWFFFTILLGTIVHVIYRGP